MTPEDTANQIEPEKKNTQRHFLAVFFYSFLWGVFGADRFYLGKYGTGVLKLLTLGGFGLWIMIDLSLVMSGAMRDRDGQEMLEYERYKKLAQNTVWIFSVFMLLILALTGLSIYWTIMEFNKNGGLEQLFNLQNQFEGVNLEDYNIPL